MDGVLGALGFAALIAAQFLAVIVVQHERKDGSGGRPSTCRESNRVPRLWRICLEQ
jgi:hypothetical protein